MHTDHSNVSICMFVAGVCVHGGHMHIFMNEV